MDNQISNDAELKSISLRQIFSVFFQLGCFTFGGGLAMLPLIQNAVVEKRQWMAKDEFVNMLAVANSAPGAFAINSGIFVGYKCRGFFGAVAAALGVVMPSFIVIITIAYLLLRGKEANWLKGFFDGVRPAVIALIMAAGLKMGKGILKQRFDFILLAIGLLLMIFTPVHPVLLIVVGAIIGLVYTRHKGVAK